MRSITKMAMVVCTICLGLPSLYGQTVTSGVSGDGGSMGGPRPALSRPGFFIRNSGWLGDNVSFFAHLSQGSVHVVNNDTLVYLLEPDGDETGDECRISEHLVDALPFNPRGANQIPFWMSTFRGNDPAKWASGLPAYESLSLGEVYPGILADLYLRDGSLEKVFTVTPNASPKQLRIEVEGGDSLRITRDGRLQLDISNGSAHFSAPVAYQDSGEIRTFVEVAYTVDGNCYGFTVGRYNPKLPLVIDPLLSCTYLGGNGKESMFCTPIVRNGEGNFFVASRTASTDYPTSSDMSTDMTSTLLGGNGDGDGGNANGRATEAVSISDIADLVDFLFGLSLGAGPPPSP